MYCQNIWILCVHSITCTDSNQREFPLGISHNHGSISLSRLISTTQGICMIVSPSNHIYVATQYSWAFDVVWFLHSPGDTTMIYIFSFAYLQAHHVSCTFLSAEACSLLINRYYHSMLSRRNTSIYQIAANTYCILNTNDNIYNWKFVQCDKKTVSSFDNYHIHQYHPIIGWLSYVAWSYLSRINFMLIEKITIGYK